MIFKAIQIIHPILQNLFALDNKKRTTHKKQPLTTNQAQKNLPYPYSILLTTSKPAKEQETKEKMPKIKQNIKPSVELE